MKLNAKSYSNLVALVLTVDDQAETEEELGTLLDAGGNGAETVASQVQPELLEAIKADIETFPVDRLTYLTEAKKYLATLPVVELTLGNQVSPQAMKRMVERLRTISGKPIIVSLMVNPALLGGAIVISQGEFRDYSLSARLQGLFTEMFGGETVTL